MHNEPRWWTLLLRGMAMGVADLVPGVSGGTMALVLGVYERLVAALRHVTAWPTWTYLLRGDVRRFWGAAHASFLAPLVLGIVIAVLTLARLVEFALAAYGVVLYATFSGLVLAATVLLARRVARWRATAVVTLLGTFTLTALLLLGSPGEGAATPLALVSAGAIGISALVLPGISGALILVLLGQYGRVVAAIAALDLATLAPFALGALIGIVSIARIMDWLLRRALTLTMAGLIGVMLASLQRVWPWLDTDAGRVRVAAPPQALGPDGWLVALLAAAAGFAAVLLLERLAGSRSTSGAARPHSDRE